MFAVTAIWAGGGVFGCAAQEVSVAALPESSDVYHEKPLSAKTGGFCVKSDYSIPLRTNFHTSKRSLTLPRRARYGKCGISVPIQLSYQPLPTDEDLGVNRFRPEEHARVFLFDTESGRTQEIPLSWFDADDFRPWAEISGDGRLVLAYSESGPEDGPVVVSVYNWRT